jgi:signal transduction histidine kinase
VPVDVPVDQPQGPVGPAPPSRWGTLFIAAYALGILLVWSSGDVRTGARVAATGLLVALGGWWWALGHRVARDDETSWRGAVYLSGVLVLFAAAVAVEPVCIWVLFGVGPQPYVLRPRRVALGWVAALNAVPVLLLLGRTGVAEPFWIQLVIAVGVTGFAHIMGTNIERIYAQSAERARLISELQESRAQIAALSREAGVAAERERLAAEIHDTLAQGFTSILTLVQAAASAIGTDPDRARVQLGLAADTARENLAEARALVGALAPAALDTASLAEALRRHAERVGAQAGIAVEVEADGELGPLSTQAQVVLLRAAQEALANVRRHSGARSATILLARVGSAVRLVVRDDGGGFDPAAPVNGFGLRGMRARAQQIGGAVHVDSGPGGTVLRVEVPA